MIHWAALGMFFKVVSWCIGYIFLAKGASKTFFWSELFSNTILLVLNILGYRFFGLEGMGTSFLMGYSLYLIMIFFIAKHKYQFSFDTGFYKIFGLQLLLGVLCFLVSRYMQTPYMYVVGIIIICISCWFSYKELDSRLDIKNIIKKFTNK
jgi:O-antigen/teichoic acid export membrane protein